MKQTTRLKKPQVPRPGELINFDDITNRPMYDGEEMTHETNIPSVEDETTARQEADNEIWEEIEAIEASSDVVDIVGTYADLEDYDTSTLNDNDIIKVIADETHSDATTYYRWNKTSQQFAYIGSEGPYYTQTQVDTLLGDKQDTLIAGDNIQIAADGKTISATDTTYSAGTNIQINGTTISATDTTYTAGTGLTLNSGEFSVDTSTIQEKLTAGTNVAINGATISAVDTKYSAGAGLTLTGTEFAVDTSAIQQKLTAGTNVQIDGTTISATDTQYSTFGGTDGVYAGTSGLVPAPAITDVNKYLHSDGTWHEVETGDTTQYYTVQELEQLWEEA
jgi:hypothetical protein